MYILTDSLFDADTDGSEDHSFMISSIYFHNSILLYHNLFMHLFTSYLVIPN